MNPENRHESHLSIPINPDQLKQLTDKYALKPWEVQSLALFILEAFNAKEIPEKEISLIFNYLQKVLKKTEKNFSIKTSNENTLQFLKIMLQNLGVNEEAIIEIFNYFNLQKSLQKVHVPIAIVAMAHNAIDNKKKCQTFIEKHKGELINDIIDLLTKHSSELDSSLIARRVIQRVNQIKFVFMDLTGVPTPRTHTYGTYEPICHQITIYFNAITDLEKGKDSPLYATLLHELLHACSAIKCAVIIDNTHAKFEEWVNVLEGTDGEEVDTILKKISEEIQEALEKGEKPNITIKCETGILNSYPLTEGVIETLRRLVSNPKDLRNVYSEDIAFVNTLIKIGITLPSLVNALMDPKYAAKLEEQIQNIRFNQSKRRSNYPINLSQLFHRLPQIILVLSLIIALAETMNSCSNTSPQNTTAGAATLPHN